MAERAARGESCFHPQDLNPVKSDRHALAVDVNRNGALEEYRQLEVDPHVLPPSSWEASYGKSGDEMPGRIARKTVPRILDDEAPRQKMKRVQAWLMDPQGRYRPFDPRLDDSRGETRPFRLPELDQAVTSGHDGQAAGRLGGAPIAAGSSCCPSVTAELVAACSADDAAAVSLAASSRAAAGDSVPAAQTAT